MQSIKIIGLDETQLDDLWTSQTDHGGNRVEPFIDVDGGWPLRCCLRDSAPGDELAIVAWSPFSQSGPYAEVGPVVVHAHPCARRAPSDQLPPQFRNRRQILRPYDYNWKIAYDHITLVEAGDDLDKAVANLIGIDDIAFIHARNVLSGCYSFAIERT